MLSIEQDGMSFNIERARSGSGERMDATLKSDVGGWYVRETTAGVPWAQCWEKHIGRRQDWKKALHEALDLIEWELTHREKALP